MNRKLRVSLALTALWFIVAASCNSEAEDGSGPEAVADALTKAIQSESYGDVLPLIVPQDRDFVVAVIFFAVIVSTSKDDIAALDKKHGLDPKGKKLNLGGSRAEARKSATEWLGHKDRGAFLTDMLRILQKHGKVSIPSGKLTDLTVDGFRGEAKLGGKPVLFVREGGKWYLTLPQG